MMRQLIVVALSFFCFLAAQAQEKSVLLSPVKVNVQPGDNVVIRGFRGDLEYVTNEKAQDLMVEVKQTFDASWANLDEWQFSFRRDGQNILILIYGPISRSAWYEVLLSKQIPAFSLKIEGPSLPLTMNWNEGKLAVKDLNANIQITTLSSNIGIYGGDGSVEISNPVGSINVNQRKGTIHINTYQASVEVSHVEGGLNLQNFTGGSKLQDINGTLNLQSFNGQTRVQQAKGRMEFNNGNSPMHIDKFEGELRGKSDQGSIFADIRGEADVRLTASEGSVNLKMPASAAWVNLGTADGSLAVPSFLKLTRSASQQIRTGRLRNGQNGGSVFVRTSSGDIRIR